MSFPGSKRTAAHQLTKDDREIDVDDFDRDRESEPSERASDAILKTRK